MAIHFVNAVKEIIKKKGLQDLTSFGWDRMRQVERDLQNGKTNEEDAIKKFLAEQNFSYTLDRSGIDEFKRMLKN